VNLIVIDDDPIQHFIMKKLLTLYLTTGPDEVTFSDNGVEVLEFLDINRDNKDVLPDLIFLDLNMPILSGWDFLERFTHIQKKIIKPIWIYIISSSIHPGDISQSGNYLFVKDYVIKPMTRLLLNKIFEVNLDKKVNNVDDTKT